MDPGVLDDPGLLRAVLAVAAFSGAALVAPLNSPGAGGKAGESWEDQQRCACYKDEIVLLRAAGGELADAIVARIFSLIVRIS